MMIILYIILLLNCFVNAFIRRSRGALFSNPNVKANFQALHYIVLIVLIIIAGINYSWMHILYMFLVDFFAYFPFGYICNKIIK